MKMIRLNLAFFGGNYKSGKKLYAESVLLTTAIAA